MAQNPKEKPDTVMYAYNPSIWQAGRGGRAAASQGYKEKLSLSQKTNKIHQKSYIRKSFLSPHYFCNIMLSLFHILLPDFQCS